MVEPASDILMMQEAIFEAAVELIRRRDTRYATDAYVFVRDALEHTMAGIRREGRPHHVTGQQLLEGIREYGIALFGPMALTVFEEWGLHACPDFGEIVFNLIDQGLLSKTETDTRADFAPGYDFRQAFRDPFLPSSKLPPPRCGDQPAPATSR